MKAVSLLGLLLLSGVVVPKPAAVHVTLTPLTKAAYLQALKGAMVTKPHVTFPLKKQHGRLVIPTAKGPRVFRDSKLEEDNPDWEQFEYKGYLPQVECHLILHRHYEWARVIMVTKSGQQLTLQEDPVFSPDQRSFVALSGGLEYWADENYVRLYRLENHVWKRAWHTEPKSWEPAAICWSSDTTLLLRQLRWPSERRTYAQLLLTR